MLFARDYFTMEDQFYFDRATYGYKQEIKLGQARVGKVNGNYWDVKIPLNRKSWALALAHGQQLIRNILRSESYPIDIFLATALKESDLGCDHDIIQEEGTEYPLGKTWDAGDGFYQIEGWGASAYGEMSKLYPKRFPEGEASHGALIGNEHFETATIGKVYYDLMVFHYWKYVNGYRPIELMDKSTDRGSLIKMLSAAFYMGHQTSGTFYQDIFLTNRDKAYEEAEFLNFFDEDPYKDDNFYNMARDHAELVHQCVKVFQDSAEIVGSPEKNEFYNFYDSLISWDDMSGYMEKLKPLYPDVSWDDITIKVKATFDGIKSGQALSFRTEIAPVIDELILTLPVENPVPGLKKHYDYAIKWHDSLEYESDFDDVSVIQTLPITKSMQILTQKNSLTIVHRGTTPTTVEIFNVRGQSLLKTKGIAQKIVVPLSGLSVGIYYAKVTQGVESLVVPLLRE